MTSSTDNMLREGILRYSEMVREKHPEHGAYLLRLGVGQHEDYQLSQLIWCVRDVTALAPDIAHALLYRARGYPERAEAALRDSRACGIFEDELWKILRRVYPAPLVRDLAQHVAGDDFPRAMLVGKILGWCLYEQYRSDGVAAAFHLDICRSLMGALESCIAATCQSNK